jgi:hypothetical protein
MGELELPLSAAVIDGITRSAPVVAAAQEESNLQIHLSNGRDVLANVVKVDNITSTLGLK